MPTIPISQIATVNPGVIQAGGAASRLSGLLLSQDTSIPPSALLDFFTAQSMSDWFGPAAPETTAGAAYFPGIVNGGQLPFDMLVGRYVLADAPAGVFGAQLTGLTLAQLQALSGTLIVTTTTLFTSSAINLSTATSFANAATIMTAAFTTPNFAITYDVQRNRFLLQTTATGIAVGAVSSAVTGTLANGVKLSAASGAVLQAVGVVADTPATAMARVIAQNTNWGTFTHSYAAIQADRLLYSAWNSGQNNQYMYVGWDTDAGDTTPNNAASFGALVFAQPYQGTLPVYGSIQTAAFVMGYAASINFNVPNGRTTLAFRQSVAGISTTVNDLTSALALLSNKYTYYGAYANQANNYAIAYDGKVSGSFLWSDTYLDQIYLNRELSRSLFEAFLAYNSLPYNQDGYSGLYMAGVDVVTAAVTSGIIRAGVTLTQSQIQQVNSQSGLPIATTLQTRGWYLLIGDPANIGQARQNRTSPFAKLWYCDGGSIQQITLNSIAVI